MFYLRTTDNAKIRGYKKEFSFDKNKRKGNKIITFELKKNQLSFKKEVLATRKIPKKDANLLNDSFIYVLKSRQSCLTFQDPTDSCHFLVFGSDGIIYPTSFVNLTEDDEILIYEDKDFLIDEIEELMIVSKDFHKGISNELSNYFIAGESGIIINDLFII